MIITEYSSYNSTFEIPEISINSNFISVSNNSNFVYKKLLDSTILANGISIINDEDVSYKLFFIDEDYTNLDINMLNINLKIENINNYIIPINKNLLTDVTNIISNYLLDIYKVNFILDIKLYNYIYNNIYNYTKIGRIYNNSIQRINTILNKDTYDLNKTNDVKFICRYKLKNNLNTKYVIPKLYNDLTENVFFDDINSVIINNNNLEEDSSANILNGKISGITLIETDETNWNDIIENSINYLYFDIYLTNFIIPRRLLFEYNNFNNFQQYPLGDVYSVYNQTSDLVLLKNYVLYKTKNNYLDFINLNINNIVISFIMNEYPDYTISDIDIFIIYNNIDNNIITKNNIVSLSPRINPTIYLINVLNKNMNKCNPVIYNNIHFDIKNIDKIFILLDENSIKLYNNTNKIFDNTIVTYDVIDNSSYISLYDLVNYNNDIQQYIDFFNERINTNLYNKVEYIKTFCLSSPFGISEYDTLNITVDTRIMCGLNYIINGISLFNITSPSGKPIIQFNYSLTDSTSEILTNYIIPYVTKKIKYYIEANINSLTYKFINKISEFIDNSYILKSIINRLYNTGLYIDYANNHMIINIHLFTKDNNYQNILNILKNEFNSLKIFIEVNINNKKFSKYLDLFDLIIRDSEIILRYYFSPVLLEITQLYAIEYFSINKIDLII